ncbi:hypothetical protein NLN86_22470 [Citrobacter portucalensis]|uniref:Uncharacterized protein n=1 Tax=Citrobacter portucalensis TaxID=1639133 RepID=A0AAW5WFE0_9ENTR|nr:hypothetical protein [Citrobacter portucalensis]MCX9004396.1 hypothetical protein [Citrobacter portucalensis]MCX9058992.1 hypothetical protein [Citrobacter portucalensis]
MADHTASGITRRRQYGSRWTLTYVMATKDITDLMICQAVYQIHQNCVQPGSRFSATVSLLQKSTGEPKKVCQAAINRAIGSGLVEWGIHHSIGWLTKEGINFLSNPP